MSRSWRHDTAITPGEITETAATIAALQTPDGMIPWFEGGHCDPWNHVETAMALDVAGMHDHAHRAYAWLASTQRPDGSWHNYYRADGSVEDTKLDTNVCAYVATGVWHHWLCTRDRVAVQELWPVVDRALRWVLSMARPDGTILWARQPDDAPWDYALLTGCSSIVHSLRCGAQLAHALGRRRPAWTAAAARVVSIIETAPALFAPKERWAMDWYYPALSGALRGEAAKARLAEGWSTFAMESHGIRCVSDEPWVTAAETAECALAHVAIGDIDTAVELLSWTRAHRREDGAYWTGIVHPGGVRFPDGEASAYTGAAVILAADAIAGLSPASGVFAHRAGSR